MIFSSFLLLYVCILFSILFNYGIIRMKEVIYMIIKHLSHSGFTVHDQSELLVFDAISPLALSNEYKNIYIFISHSHKDHFDSNAVKEFYQNEKANFIISKELSPKISQYAITNLSILENYEKVKINHLDVSSYGSTDLGNSYMVTLHGNTYFHSGDLNWWHWKRMNLDELKSEESSFIKEIDQFKDKSIDFAFIPVDPRLEEHGYLAINYFIDVVQPKYVIPMHSFGQYDFYKDLELHIDLQDSVLINVDGENRIIFEG